MVSMQPFLHANSAEIECWEVTLEVHASGPTVAFTQHRLQRQQNSNKTKEGYLRIMNVPNELKSIGRLWWATTTS